VDIFAPYTFLLDVISPTSQPTYAGDSIQPYRCWSVNIHHLRRGKKKDFAIGSPMILHMYFNFNFIFIFIYQHKENPLPLRPIPPHPHQFLIRNKLLAPPTRRKRIPILLRHAPTPLIHLNHIISNNLITARPSKQIDKTAPTREPTSTLAVFRRGRCGRLASAISDPTIEFAHLERRLEIT
jgi:hypothetical protein